MSLPVPIELIRLGSKQRGRVTSITAENTPLSCIHEIKDGNVRVDDKMDH